MGWMEAVADAVQYIEDNITEDLSVDNIAKYVHVSSFYFQNGYQRLRNMNFQQDIV